MALTSSPALRRSWWEFVSLPSFSRPYAFGEALMRLRINLDHFQLNYLLIWLTLLLLSLLFHPISLIVFLLFALFWYWLYISRRDEPITVFSFQIKDGVVVMVLSVATVVCVGLTGVWLNVVAVVAIEAVVVVGHGVFRSVEDLYRDEDEVLVSVVGSPVN